MATQVRRGKFLWSDFEKAGKCLPAKETKFNSKKAEWMVSDVKSTSDGTPPPKKEKKLRERPDKREKPTPEHPCISCGLPAVTIVDGFKFCGKCAPEPQPEKPKIDFREIGRQVFGEEV